MRTFSAKSQIAAGTVLPTKGTVFISVRNQDKDRAVEVARKLHAMGFKILATRGTCIKLIESNIPSEFVRKVIEGLSLEVAAPEEARDILALKGGDTVAF